MKVRIIDTQGEHRQAVEEVVTSRQCELTEDRDFDVLVAVVSSQSTAAGFVIAEAAERQRYVLVLIPEGFDKHGIRAGSKFLTLKTFNEQSLVGLVKDYVDRHRRGNLKRFNFVIPRELADYLETVPQQKGKSKSDFVRDLINQSKQQDEDYISKD